MKTLIKGLITKDTLFVAFILMVSVGLLLFTDTCSPKERTVTAIITHIEDNTDLESGWYKMGGQQITARIISGSFKGHSLIVLNSLTGNFMLDRYVKVGDQAIFILYLEKGNIQQAKLVDYDRQSWHLILFTIFSVLIILFARYTGVKALVSFVFTVLVMFKIGIPLIIKGYDPLFLCSAFALLFGIITLSLVGGFSIRTLSAIIGLMISVILSASFTVFAGKGMMLFNVVSDKAITLYYSGYSHLEVEKLFWGTVIFGASGAMVDVAGAVATSVREVVKANPALSAKRLIHSGLEVGRAAMGTMVTTLLLAYTGCSLFLLLVFTAKGTHFSRIINFNLISAEILRTLAGSIGIVMVAPITAVAAGLLYHRFYGSTRKNSSVLKIRINKP